MTKPTIRKRYIRIKEFGVSATFDKRPEDAYMKMVNNSLAQENYCLTIDDNGFITDPAQTAGSNAPVYVLGDSLVESTFVHQGQRFCDLLTRRMSGGGVPRQFLNGGYSGATSLTLLNTLVNKIGCRENAAVILILPSNDTQSLEFDGGFWDLSNQRYSPILPVNGARSQKSLQADNLHQLDRVLRAFAHLSNAFGLDLYFATTPFVQVNYKREPWYKARFEANNSYEAMIAARRMSNQVMRNVAAATRVELVDLEQIVARPKLFYDDLHLNAEGSAFVANAIYDHIGTALIG